MLWLGVHFPRLPLEVFTAGRVSPEPEVVIHDGRVVMCNPAAAETGIALGSTLATAHSIAAGIRHYRRTPQREFQRLALLAEVLYGFSARVSLMPAAAGVVLEVGGSLRLFGDVERLVDQIRMLCDDMGHEVRLRTAPTPLACLTLARADVASLAQVPLSQAAIEAEPFTPDRVERLANMGIHALGQLLNLPSRGVADRFGKHLVDYLSRLTGERPDPRPVISPPERFRSTLHLLEPLRSKEALVFPMQRLLIDLQHWLIARQLGAEQLRWRFRGGGERDRDIAPNVELEVRFGRAQQRREAFLEITRLQMADAQLPAEVIDLELEARRLVPWAAGSRGLFHNQPGMHSPADESQGADELVDQLRARLGHTACYSLKVRRQHLPEQAWAATPPTLATPRRTSRRKAASSASPDEPDPHRTPTRPLWLFDQPRPIALRQLTLLRGPERIHTGWWLNGGEPVRACRPQASRLPNGTRRDYYVARHQSGAECWVFVDHRDRWFLHGYFS
jgi:protein ImuB